MLEYHPHTAYHAGCCGRPRAASPDTDLRTGSSHPYRHLERRLTVDGTAYRYYHLAALNDPRYGESWSEDVCGWHHLFITSDVTFVR